MAMAAAGVAYSVEGRLRKRLRIDAYQPGKNSVFLGWIFNEEITKHACLYQSRSKGLYVNTW